MPAFKPVIYNPPDSDSDDSDGSVVSQRSQASSHSTVLRGSTSYSVSIRKPETGSGVVVRCSGSPTPKGPYVNIELKKPDAVPNRFNDRCSPLNDVSASSIQQECRDYEALVPTYACRLPPSAPDRREVARSVLATAPARLVSYHGSAYQQASVHTIPLGNRSFATAPESTSSFYRSTVQREVQQQSPNSNVSSAERQTSPPQQFVSEYRSMPRMSDIRHYQLTPTMDLCGTRSPPVSTPSDHQSPQRGKEAELDVLTSLLVQNMHAAAEPDFLGKYELF